MIGKILGLPFRVLNAPIRAAENLFNEAAGAKDTSMELRIASKPLDALAEALEEIDK